MGKFRQVLTDISFFFWLKKVPYLELWYFQPHKKRKNHLHGVLAFATLLANSADDKLIFFCFSQKTGFDISCKLLSKPIFSEK